MKYDLRKSIIFFIIYIISITLVSYASVYLAEVLDLNVHAIAVNFYLPISFVITYFYYPRFLRKNIFSNPVYYKDSGVAFFIFLLIHIINNVL